MSKEKKKIDFKPKYKWSEISSDLQNYFIIRGIIVGALLLIGIYLAFEISYKMVVEVYYVALLAYLIWKGYYLLATLYGKVSSYIGIVEKKKGRSYQITKPISKQPLFDYQIFGKSMVIMSITRTSEDGSEDTAKFEVPVGQNFDAEEGDAIVVYVLKSGVFRKNTNTYTITNPIFVKVYST